MPESIDAHLYLVDNSITMIPLASGVDDIIPDVQSSMVLLSLITVIVPTYTNSTVSYCDFILKIIIHNIFTLVYMFFSLYFNQEIS